MNEMIKINWISGDNWCGGKGLPSKLAVVKDGAKANRRVNIAYATISVTSPGNWKSPITSTKTPFTLSDYDDYNYMKIEYAAAVSCTYGTGIVKINNQQVFGHSYGSRSVVQSIVLPIATGISVYCYAQANVDYTGCTTRFSLKTVTLFKEYPEE